MKRIRGLLTILVVVLIFALSACNITIENGNDNNDNGNDNGNVVYDGSYNQELFEEVFEKLLDNHYKDLSEEQLYEAALRGLFGAIEDPYTRYLTKEEAQQHREGLGEEFVGVGITIENIDDNVVVRKVWSDSPAEAAGMQPGDRITHVDGTDYRQKSYVETVTDLLGEEGTTVEIGVARGGVEETIFFTMERERIPNPTVVYDVHEIDGKTIGYLEINTFGGQTAGLVEDALEHFEDEMSIEGLIIDLRDNSGGYLNAVNNILDMFLPAGDKPMFTIEQWIGGEPVGFDYDATGEETKPYDIVTIVNEYSASASEVFAAAMIEKGGYDVYGMPTFGKGTMQVPHDLMNEGVIHISEGRWLTPDGHWINRGDGDYEHVSPTVEVAQNPYFKAYSVYLRDDETLEYDTVSTRTANAQTILNALGYDVRDDGYFDEETENAVTDFQTEHDLETNGKIDHDTAAKLNELYHEYRTSLKYDEQFQAALAHFNGE